jgi:hypothetical protein
MISDWAFVLILASANILDYLFAAPEKKREAGIQAFTSSLALLISFCVMRFAMPMLMATEASLVEILLWILAGVLVYILVHLIVGFFTWRIFRGFLQKP